MRARLTGLATVLGLVLAGTASSEPLKPALSAATSFTAPNGEQLRTIEASQLFAIEVRIESGVGADPPGGLFLNGWLRPVSARNLKCTEAARAYLATRRVPAGSVDLNGPVIGVLNEGGALTIVDPDLDLASANLTGAAQFDEEPAGIAADPFANRFLVTLPEAGEVRAVSAFGGAETLASGLSGLSGAYPAPGGGVWILADGKATLYRDGAIAAAHEATAIRGPTELHAETAGASIALVSDTAVALADAATGALLASVPASGAVDAAPLAGATGSVALAVLAASEVRIHYLDAPERPVIVPLAAEAARIVADPSGRYLFAYAPAGGSVQIVDVARSHVAQVVGAEAPIAEIAFAGRAAFLMLADQSRVGAIDLSSIRRGSHAQVRDIALGAASDPSDGSLLVPLPPLGRMLAVHRDSFTGFVLEDSSAMGDAPPMTAIRLRGGVPAAAVALDRGFREGPAGTFRTTAMLPRDGAWELVATTGIGSLSFCASIPTQPTPRAEGPGTILAEAEGQDLSFRFVDAAGEPVPVSGELTFSALASGWRRHARVSADESGRAGTAFRLPPIGLIVVTIRARDHDFHPLVTEVLP